VADAITCATTTQYCAVLTDLLLPDNDGVTLISSLRELPHYRDTPLIVVSANPLRGSGDPRSAELHVSDWLSKPVDFERLKLALANVVTNHARSAL
jgi:CheY-like chemotaxis protein